MTKTFWVENKRTINQFLTQNFVFRFTSAFAYYGIVLLTTEMFQTNINGCNPYNKREFFYLFFDSGSKH